ncbi:hypothetical protein HPP92_000678 [Vanilla planifolia]|uniref:STAS domain-containing protein n=1 Tax=Vanilla planifolia TaxID=51239 RepID=A0A835S1V7_VANPL|nr:hypothetical protein HPP92_000678 [Vanilla planifolia]
MKLCRSVENSSECVQDIESCSLPLASNQLHHKVPVPQSKDTVQAVKQWAGECFFPDDPLHKVKNQKSIYMKLVFGLQYIFPIMLWGSDYSLALFKSDAIAGLTIACMAIPQGISYAKLAYLPPNIGLYSSFVPPLVYLVLGSSRDLAVGPSSIVSVVLGSMLREAVSPDDNPMLFLQLAFTSTFFAGLFQAALGLLRMGFVVEFLSEPTLVGFMGGAAVVTVLQQLKGLLGIKHFATKTGFIPMMQSLFEHTSELHWKTMVMGISFLLFLYLTKYVVGHLDQGLNPPSIKMLLLHGSYLMLTIKTGIITGILSITVDGNKEMVALGIMNLAGSCSSCFVTTGSFSRSAVNYNSGCKTAISNMVMSCVVLVTMMFLMPLFYYTPNVVLSVAIIIAAIGLIHREAPIRLWKVDKLDFFAYLTAFFGVLFISVPIGLGIAMGISILKILIPVTRPNIVIMGNVLGTECYRSLTQYKEAIRVPHFLILGIEFPIYFASSVYLQDRILRWVREEEERASKIKEKAVSAIDSSGIEALLELKKKLNRRSLQLVLANPIGEVANKLFVSEAWEKFGSDYIYMNVAEAVSSVPGLAKISEDKNEVS